jgi:hypothetical protein
MTLTNFSVDRQNTGSTRVYLTLEIERGASFDLDVVNRAIALLDSGGDVPDVGVPPRETIADGPEPGSALEANPTKGRRGRRTSSVSEPQTEAGSTVADTSTGQAEASPTTGRRGRRSGATPAADAGASPAATASTAETKSPSEPEPAKEPVRRRRAQPEEPAGISDADVAKAASEAARVLGNPEEVMDILGEFGVTETSALPQNVRQEFLDICNVEIEKQG